MSLIADESLHRSEVTRCASQPAGLTLGPKVDLLVGCNTLFDTAGNIWDSTKDVTAAPFR